jgi:hypothetical protein
MEIVDSVKSVNDTRRSVTSADRPTSEQAGDTSMRVENIKMVCIDERGDVLYDSPFDTFTESNRKMGDPFLTEYLD